MNIATAMLNTRRVPKRSAIQPLIGMPDREAQNVAGYDRLEAERRDMQDSPPSPELRC